MPIGKNAIKRVANNGYSNVKTTAPDMENSVEVNEVAVTEEKKSNPKKTAVKGTSKTATAKKTTKTKATAPKKSMETEPELAPLKTLEKVANKTDKTPKRQGDGYVNLGGELPYYLL